MTDEASLSCPLCKSLLNSSDSLLLLCHRCLSWFHSSCLGLQDEEVENRATSNSSWSCPQCVSLEDPNDSISTCLDFVACPVCIDKSFKGKKGLRINWARAHPDQPFTEGCSGTMVTILDVQSGTLNKCVEVSKLQPYQ